MSTDESNRKSSLFARPLSNGTEAALRKLVEAGCDRKFLLASALLLVMVDGNEKEIWKQAMGLTEADPHEQLRKIIKRIRDTADDIKEINAGSLLGSGGLRTFAGIDGESEAPPAISAFEGLPSLLGLYAVTLEKQMDYIKQTLSLKGEPARNLILMDLFRYLKEKTGQPNYGPIADFLNEFGHDHGRDFQYNADNLRAVERRQRDLSK